MSGFLVPAVPPVLQTLGRVALLALILFGAAWPARAATPDPAITDPANAADASSLGADYGQQTLDWSTNFEQNISAPMQGSESDPSASPQMTTPSGKKLNVTPQGEEITDPEDAHFDADIYPAASSTTALSVFIQLSPPVVAGTPTDGIQLLRVSQDRDFNDSFDYQFEYSSASGPPISGICADGFIVCNPGSWNACIGYRWEANTTGAITTGPAPLAGSNGLKTCFCINGSCNNAGVDSPASQERILRILAQGVIYAIQQQHPEWSFAEKSVVAPVAEFYGADTGGATVDTDDGSGNETTISVGASGFVSSAKTWKNDPEGMVSSGETQFATGLSDPTSPVAQTTAAFDQQATGYVERACRIVYNFDVDYTTANELCSLSGSNWELMQPTRVDPSSFLASTLLQQSNWNGITPSRLATNITVLNLAAVAQCSLTGTMTGTYTVLLDGTPVTTFAGTGSPLQTVTLTPYLSNGSHTLEIQKSGGSSTDTVVLSLVVQESCTITDVSSTTCTDYESDPDCVLYWEKQDDIVTRESGTATGLSPTPTSRRFGSGVCSAVQSVSAWRTERIYRCNTPTTGFDYDSAIEVSSRAGESRNSGAIDPESGTSEYNMLYRQNIDDPTAPAITADSSVTMDFSTYPIPDTEDCQKVCRTRVDAQNTDLNTRGPSDQMTTSSLELEYRVYTCTGPSNDICPAPAGETIIQDCDCETGFAEVASKVQALNEAREEVICSDGVKK